MGLKTTSQKAIGIKRKAAATITSAAASNEGAPSASSSGEDKRPKVSSTPSASKTNILGDSLGEVFAKLLAPASSKHGTKKTLAASEVVLSGVPKKRRVWDKSEREAARKKKALRASGATGGNGTLKSRLRRDANRLFPKRFRQNNAAQVHETELRRIATRGVVKLFNAIAATQKITAKPVLKEKTSKSVNVVEPLLPGRAFVEKKVSAARSTFLDMLRGKPRDSASALFKDDANSGTLESGDTASNVQNKSKSGGDSNKGASWNVLSDDFFNSRIKEWAELNEDMMDTEIAIPEHSQGDQDSDDDYSSGDESEIENEYEDDEIQDDEDLVFDSEDEE